MLRLRLLVASRVSRQLANPQNIRIRHSASAAIMPPKRKRNGAHPPPPAPTNTDGPRRSSRRMKEVPEDKGSNGRLKPDIDEDSKTQVQSVWDSGKGVDRVMRNLSQMEHKLQSELRRQQLAVETSNLSQEGSADTLVRPPSNTIDVKKSHDADAPDYAPPITGYEADLAVGDLIEAKADDDGVDRSAKRRPPVNSETLPLPWSGRLGYACLNTYLRTCNPPVFSSRTCRISSIIEHRHPLMDPTQPEHATKNRPDKTRPPSIERGAKFVQELGLANARDIPKMLRWNDKYGIKFMRLSSEMFPFASHEEYGYKLAPFASEVLAETGQVAAELGHRLTTHPGQYTQIGSPRKEVVKAAIRDLEYHDEMLSLLKLPEQQNRDAVMILHMGGTYGDKAATLDRFRENYATLSQGVKNRLVLENDDVSWTVHDLLPVCEELNIPMVLDFHHHNIMFDAELIREGTLDIMQLFDRITATWTRKGIRQKMHYSESVSGAVTPRERRKHSARVKTLPSCPPSMDLMIEAKDKEQAVFELMRTFRLPGWDLFNDLVPYERDDESKKEVRRKKSKGGKNKGEQDQDDDIEIPERIVSANDLGMGGSDNRVYWPEGMENWLRPRKREVKKGKAPDDE